MSSTKYRNSYMNITLGLSLANIKKSPFDKIFPLTNKVLKALRVDFFKLAGVTAKINNLKHYLTFILFQAQEGIENFRLQLLAGIDPKITEFFPELEKQLRDDYKTLQINQSNLLQKKEEL